MEFPSNIPFLFILFLFLYISLGESRFYDFGSKGGHGEVFKSRL
jgi:hypothetical protein